MSVAEMSDSGIGWIGKIPTHWQIRKFRYCGTIPNGQVDPRLPEFRDRILVAPNHIESGTGRLLGTETADEQGAESGKYLFRSGDVLYSKIRPELAKVCLIDFPGLCSADMYPISPNRDLCAGFLSYQMICIGFTESVVLASARVAMPKVNRDELGGISLVIPSLPEQKTISTFLDRKTAHIDTLIAKKQRLIKLLQEKRQAQISHAVTKGLDTNVSMKDAGVEWLGAVPEHWNAVPLKYLAYIQSGVTLGKTYDDRDVVSRPYLRVANVQDGFLELSEITYIDLPSSDVSRYELRDGDVLMTEGGDFDKLGRGYVWRNEIAGCLHQNHVFAVRPSQGRLQPDFLALLLTSSHGKNYFTSTSQQTTNLATTNRTKLGDFLLPLPPLVEQDRIIEYIRRASGQIQKIGEKLTDQITKLQEYRQTLITAAVTGKIDVTKEAHL